MKSGNDVSLVDEHDIHDTIEKEIRRNERMKEVRWPLYLFKKNENDCGYLLGTTHVGSEEMYPFPDSMQQIIMGSSLLVTEVNIEGFLFGIDPEDMLLPNEEKITDDMSEETIIKFVSVLEEVGIPLEQVERTKMSFISAMITFQNNNVYKTEYAVETMLKELAPNIPNSGLETMQQQLNMLDAVYQDMTKEQWLDGIDDTKNTEEELHNLMDAYIGGYLEIYFLEHIKNQKILSEEELLHVRNEKWISQMVIIAEEEKQPFFAVGAGHLYGVSGLLHLLEKVGYQIKAL